MKTETNFKDKEMKKDHTTPFNMRIPPKKQNPFLMPLIWLGSYLLTRKNRLKIERKLRGIKPPFLVLATHQGFSDYYVAPLALFPHRANYVSDMEGFWAFGEWLYRSVGCIGKRRFVSDVSVLWNLKKCVQRGQSVVVYPESRHCNAGTTSYLPDHLGKLAKYLNVPVVILSTHGSYLESPFWDEEYSRKAPITAKLECLYTKDELQNADEEEIQGKAAHALQYDEYAWQQENKIILKHSRANGLHKVLYLCPHCKSRNTLSPDISDSFTMTSDEEGIACGRCNARWKLTALGELEYNAEHENKNGKKEFITVPAWYEWERTCAINDWNGSSQKVTYSVHVEALPNSYGFIDCGSGTLELNQDAFILNYSDQRLVFPHRIRESVQTEYNYKGKGMCIVLSTRDNCYYIYSKDRHFNPTWLQFIAEYLYQRGRKL